MPAPNANHPRPPHSSALRSGRHSASGAIYLITTTTHARAPLFVDLAITRLVADEMRRLQADGDARTLAWVLMPEHWHWLMQLGDGPSLPALMNLAKGRSARAINQQLSARSGPVWQPGFHDRALRSDENLQAAARYIIENPLRAGLVDRIGDYPWWDCVWLGWDGQ